MNHLESVDPTGGQPSRDIQRLRVMLRTRGQREVPQLAKIRSDFEAFSRLFSPPKTVTSEPVSLRGVPAERLTPPLALSGGTFKGTVLYLHGGGFVSGSLDTHRDLASRISLSAGLPVVNVDYRLAPEHPFPSALEDARTAYQAVVETTSASQLAIAGDSAGAALALSLVIKLRDEDQPLPCALGLMSPWADLTNSGDSIKRLADRDPLITEPGLEAISKLYLGGTDPRNPQASPLFAPLHALPPTLVQASADEILLDDSVRLVRKLRQAGTTAYFERWTGMVHVWQYFAGLVSEGQMAIERMGQFLASKVSLDSAS